MRLYAEKTSVPVGRSQQEIRTILERHSASGFIFGEQDARWSEAEVRVHQQGQGGGGGQAPMASARARVERDGRRHDGRRARAARAGGIDRQRSHPEDVGVGMKAHGASCLDLETVERRLQDVLDVLRQLNAVIYEDPFNGVIKLRLIT